MPGERMVGIMEERESIYGPPNLTFRVLASFNRVFRNACLHNDSVSASEQEVISMIMLKLSRIALGQFHEDNYDDISNYAQIAKELGRDHNAVT